MPEIEKSCPHCLGTGYNYDTRSNNQYCTSCNGTGIKGDPAMGFVIIVLVLAAVAVAAFYVAKMLSH